MTTAQEIKHCTMDDIGLELTGEGAQPLIDDINKYLHGFAARDGNCPKCGSKLGGLLGSFTWGLAWGEGICTGGFTGQKCGWPCRAYHDIKGSDGEKIFEQPLPIILAYHPEFVTERKPKPDSEE